MPLGLEVGLGPGHIVLDGDPAPPQKKGAQPAIFCPCPLWPNVWMDQDATWSGCRPRPRRCCVRWQPRSPSPLKKGGTAPPPILGACLLWPRSPISAAAELLFFIGLLHSICLVSCKFYQKLTYFLDRLRNNSIVNFM